MPTTVLQTTKSKPNSVPCNAPAVARNDVLEPIPLATRDEPSVDEFLDTTKRVLGYAITTKGITIARDSDIDIASGKGEITVRSVLADRTQLEARHGRRERYRTDDLSACKTAQARRSETSCEAIRCATACRLATGVTTFGC